MKPVAKKKFRPPHRRHGAGGKRPGASAPQLSGYGQRRAPPGRIAPADARRHYERYLALARDAAASGDTIEMENCYQHAEHYLRMMREHMGEHEAQ
jgi:hypothetical protein